MEPNPYAPLNTYEPPLLHSDNDIGLWRDTKYLVVRLTDPVFPDQCLKTAEPCNTRTPIRVEYVPKKTLWAIAGGAIGLAIAKALYGKTFTLDLPIATELVAKNQSNRKRAIRTVVYSLGLFVVAVIVFVFAMGAGANETVAAIAITPFLLLPILAAVGAMYYSFAQKPLVGVAKITDTHAWLSGVSKSYLDELPPWEN